MTLLAAGAFLTFLGFLFAGLLALGVTAALDRSIGKEKALLLFSGVLLLFSLWQCKPDPIKAAPETRAERTIAASPLEMEGDPLWHPGVLQPVDFRNPYQKHSDTRPLAPVELESPPWLAIPFTLPPTIPGPAPGARRVLRGELPSARPGDGSSVAEIPDPVFADYTPVAEDLYDWVFSSNRRTYVYILRIRGQAGWVAEDEPGYDALLWRLTRKEQGWEDLQVEYALVGSEEAASQRLERTAVLEARRSNRSTAPANQFESWFPRRSVANLYREALADSQLPRDPTTSADIGALQLASETLAEVGATGKESRAGWRRAAELLEIALIRARASATPGLRAEILERLVKAYGALRDEQAILRVLAEYARTSPGRPEPWVWLGELHLARFGLPAEALAYFRTALGRLERHARARRGEGDALSALGQHERALAAYELAGSDYDAKVRQAEALLRLGRLDMAMRAADAALASRPGGPRALLAKGGALYADGQVESARDLFERAAGATGDDALEFRAQAAYDLGLACWRLGQADAAVAAFEACEKALQFGSAPGRFDDETVSPAFGRALVSLSADNASTLRAAMQEAREEAPRVSYHEMLSGALASREGNDAAAVRAFERARRLVGVYPELDGWLGRTYLNLGRLALQAGTPIKEAAGDFERAVAFAARAAATEEKVDPDAYAPTLREAWVRMGAEHVAVRERFKAARDVAARVLTRVDREQPAALSIQGYCNYRLAAFGDPYPEDQTAESPYDYCLRDLTQVTTKVQPDDEGPWKSWRAYAVKTLAAVKHWLSLEEKIVTFDDTLPEEWVREERHGVRAQLVDGVILLDDAATKDGTAEEPTFVLTNEKLFTMGQFQELRILLRIPRRDASGAAKNTVTFGVAIQRGQRRGRGELPGIGVYYDRGYIARWVGNGREELYKERGIHRPPEEPEWPSDGWVEVRIVRLEGEEGEEGALGIYLDADLTDDQPGDLIVSDVVAGFKGSSRSTTAALWIGGFGPQAQRYDVQIGGIEVVRRKQ